MSIYTDTDPLNTLFSRAGVDRIFILRDALFNVTSQDVSNIQTKELG